MYPRLRNISWSFCFGMASLEYKYRPARYHMLFALRILIAGIELPSMQAYKMEAYFEEDLRVA